MNIPGRAILANVAINSNVKLVWDSWTTEDGAKAFFAPDCKIELRPDGPYEMYFAPESPEGLRGGEGCRVMAIQPMHMFSFTWNAPPSLPQVRGHYTHVTLLFTEEEQGTKLTLMHDGWGKGGEWDKAYRYFNVAWKQVVIPRLINYLETGPIDWENPPIY